jgi:hypothetical protein
MSSIPRRVERGRRNDDSTDQVIWTWDLVPEHGPTLPVDVMWSGSASATAPELLGERLAEAIRTQGRSEAERLATDPWPARRVIFHMHRRDPVLSPRAFAYHVDAA